MAFSHRTGLLVVALLSAIAGAAICLTVTLLGATKAAATPAHSDLVPTRDQVIYRFSTAAPDARIELDQAIKALEARVATGQQALDLAELAEYYYARGQLSGDKRDYDAAQVTASKSLE